MKAIETQVGPHDAVIELHGIGEKRTFKIVDVNEFMATEFPPRKPIIEPFLCGQGTAMI